MAEVVVQRVIFSAAADRQRLYATISGPSSDQGEQVAVSAHSIRVPGRAALCTDTYFNALFEDVWLQAGAVQRWRLRIAATGTFRITVNRHGPSSGARSKVAVHAFVDSCDTIIDVAPAPAGPTRLSFDLEAGEGDVTVHEAAWLAVVDAVRPVSLVAGFCCFRNDDLVLANVSQLLGDEALRQVLGQLVLVDQGGEGILAVRVPKLAGAAGRVAVVEQGNFGGSGGFARVMMEALAYPGATHVLLMDDDVATEPECLRRTAVMFAIAAGEIAIGGQMLDLDNPLILHEAGAQVLERKLQARALGRGIDATAGPTLDFLMQPLRVDYNAWFYFAAPLQAVQRVGLPMPFFINFDDVEYGIRLRSAGVRLVSVPGIAIWHRTGAGKETRWRAYYYQRNTLVINAQHHLCSRGQVARIFLKRWLSAVARRDVVRPKLACRAVRDYLKGPTGIDPKPDAFCADIRSLCASAPRKRNNPFALLASASVAAVYALRLWLKAPAAESEWQQAEAVLRTERWWQHYVCGAPPTGAETGAQLNAGAGSDQAAAARR
ncbi:MAG: glycosyltransferase [Defluviicoccus sp.]